MRRLWCAVVLAAMLSPSVASAQRVSVDEHARAAAWVTARERAARAGAADLVEVPLVSASEGWGCICPGSYLGASPDFYGEIAWLEVVLAPGVALPEPSSRGSVSIVRGHFTGVVRHVQMGEGGEPAGYDLHELVVTEVVRPRAPESSDVSLSLRVQTRGAVPCTSAVEDTTPLRIRARASADAEIVTELPNGTPVTIVRMRGAWLEISAPVAGWAHRDHVRTSCAPRP